MATWAMGPRGNGAQEVMITGGMGHMGNRVQGYGAQYVRMSKDVNLSKRCQMSKNQTPRLWRRFTKKKKLTQ